MKFIIAIAFFVVSANAGRQFNTKDIDFKDESSVRGFLMWYIKDMSDYMKEIGLDPLYIEKDGRNYSLPVPVIFNCGYMFEEFRSNGMSNIVVNSAIYNIFTSSLHFDIELPHVDGSVRAASMASTFFGETIKMNTSGKVAFESMRFVGQIRMDLNLTSGVSVRSTKVSFTMGGIKSDVTLFFQDDDYSDKMNMFLNSTLPATFKAYRSEIDQLLGILLMDYANQYLKEHQY